MAKSLKLASQRSQGLDLTTFERALRNAINIRGFIQWKQVSNYAQGIESVLNSIKEMLEDHPPSVLKLCEYAMPLFEKALNSVDDSSGEVGRLMDEFEELHFNACELAKPDPTALAYYLLCSEMDSGFGGFNNGAETYALILGSAGLAHYRKLAESMWQEFPALLPKDVGDSNFKRRKIQHILETLAKTDGNIESVVAIKRQDLSNARSYLEIAQLYLQDGQRDLALDWAESGLKSFEHNVGLRDFAIEEYFHRGQIEDAMALMWQSFTQSITLQSYQKLKIQAERAKQWKTKRNEALDYVRQILNSQSLEGTQARRSHKTISVPTLPAWNPSGMFVLDHSLLVEIFLWEGENDLAWQEAQTGGCSNQIWLQLAEQRQLSHPEDALPIYKREVELLLKQTHNAAYANAITFLKQVRSLTITLHQQVEYNTFVAYLRKNYKAKRNFIALLDKRR
jgi:tetratricopeptide (TPR) repeat protein